MSYILEGLKKLEQKRQQEEKPPHLLTFQGDSSGKPPGKPIWPYLIFAVLLLNAGVFIWWIAPWRSTEKATPPARPVTRKSGPAAVKTIPVEPRGARKQVPLKGIQQSSAANNPTTEATGTKAKKALSPAAKETPVPKQPHAAIPSPPAKNNPVTDGRVVKLNELPPEIRNNLPDLKMSAHFYSADQQARFARVNDRIFHEGETLSEGLKVEEINPGGTVFNYKGYRFQIGINENR
jgi:general secretion pathway protein B